MKRPSMFGRKKIGALSGALTAGFAIAALALFIPSANAQNLVQLQSPGYVRTHGVVVEATVLVMCKLRRPHTVGAASTPARATLRIDLVERVGKGTAGGTGKIATKNGDFRCDGDSHLVQILVPANSAGRAFKKGTAFGQTTLKICRETCHSVSDAREIKLR